MALAYSTLFDTQITVIGHTTHVTFYMTQKKEFNSPFSFFFFLVTVTG